MNAIQSMSKPDPFSMMATQQELAREFRQRIPATGIRKDKEGKPHPDWPMQFITEFARSIVPRLNHWRDLKSEQAERVKTKLRLEYPERLDDEYEWLDRMKGAH